MPLSRNDADSSDCPSAFLFAATAADIPVAAVISVAATCAVVVASIASADETAMGLGDSAAWRTVGLLSDCAAHVSHSVCTAMDMSQTTLACVTSHSTVSSVSFVRRVVRAVLLVLTVPVDSAEIEDSAESANEEDSAGVEDSAHLRRACRASGGSGMTGGGVTRHGGDRMPSLCSPLMRRGLGFEATVILVTVQLQVSIDMGQTWCSRLGEGTRRGQVSQLMVCTYHMMEECETQKRGPKMTVLQTN